MERRLSLFQCCVTESAFIKLAPEGITSNDIHQFFKSLEKKGLVSKSGGGIWLLHPALPKPSDWSDEDISIFVSYVQEVAKAIARNNRQSWNIELVNLERGVCLGIPLKISLIQVIGTITRLRMKERQFARLKSFLNEALDLCHKDSEFMQQKVALANWISLNRQLAKVCIEMRTFQQGTTALEFAIKYVSPSTHTYGKVLSDLAMLYRLQNQHDKSERAILDAVSIFAQLGKWDDFGELLYNHSLLLSKKRSYWEALHRLNIAIGFFHVHEMRYSLMVALNAKGNIFFQLGKIEDSINAFRNSFEIAVEDNFDTVRMQGIIAKNIGDAYRALIAKHLEDDHVVYLSELRHDYLDKMVSSYKLAISTFLDLGDGYLAGVLHQSIGEVHALFEEYEATAYYYKIAYDWFIAFDRFQELEILGHNAKLIARVSGQAHLFENLPFD